MTTPMPGFDPHVLACLTVAELQGSARDAQEGRKTADGKLQKLTAAGVDRGTLAPLAKAVDRWELSFWCVQRELDARGAEGAVS